MPRKLPHHRDTDSDSFKYRGGDNPTSTSLLIRLKGGESQAWDTFMELYTPLIRYWCRRAKNQLKRPDRQDILQEVLGKISKSIDQFDHANDVRYFRAWLRRITENCIIDHLNERRKKEDFVQLFSDTDHIDGLARSVVSGAAIDFELTEQPSEKIVLLRQILKMVRSDFTEKSWDIFNLLVNADKTSAEVAAQMGLKPDSVRRTRARILQRIYEEYEKLGLTDEMPDKIDGM